MTPRGATVAEAGTVAGLLDANWQVQPFSAGVGRATSRKCTMTIDHAAWHKGRYSDLPGARAVRDSKNPTGLVLMFTGVTWSRFTAGVRAGDFDDF